MKGVALPFEFRYFACLAHLSLLFLRVFFILYIFFTFTDCVYLHFLHSLVAFFFFFGFNCFGFLLIRIMYTFHVEREIRIKDRILTFFFDFGRSE